MNLAVAGELAGWQGAFWLAMLLNLAVKGSLLLLLALGLGLLLRTDLPARRSRVWTVLFALLIALPAVTVALSLSEHRLEAAVPWAMTEPVITVIQTAPPEMTGDWSSLNAAPTPDEAAAATPRRSYWPLAVVVWLAGAAALLARLALRWGYGHWLARRSCDATGTPAAVEIARLQHRLGVRRVIRVGFSVEAPIPFVTGLRHHHLVLPAALADWEIEHLRPILLHELAHLLRRDLLRLLLGDLACALYWFQPLVWYAARRSALDQELACDDAVCGQRIKATEYARVLLGFVAERQTTLAAVRAAGFARASGLEKRLLRILDRRHRPANGTARWLAATTMGLALISSVGLVTAGLVASMPEQPPITATTAPFGAESAPARIPVAVATASSTATIHEAATAGDARAVFSLLDRDPSLLDARDAGGMTPLALAAWHDHPDLAARLLAAGADPDLKNHNGLTPLFSALDRGRLPTARVLIEHGAETASLGYNRRSLLHMAARAGDRWTLDHLLARGADINATDHEGVTPLDLAVWGNKTAMAEYLASLGARRSELPDPSYHRWKKGKLHLT